MKTMSTQKHENTFSYYKSSGDTLPKCCARGCKDLGKHKVIIDFDAPKEAHYMCLDHVKEYNKTVDYFKDMNSEEIESEVRADGIWRLPTWPLRGDSRLPISNDPFDFFKEDPSYHSSHDQKSNALPQDIEEAMKIIDVSFPLTLKKLKKTYKDQVKKYHPDLNHGQKDREEKLKKINIAYKVVYDYLNDA